MGTEKECPHCGVWTAWEKQPDDRCGSCNELLDPISLSEKKEKRKSELFRKMIF
jgi:methionyl-tRNA synthetase